MKARFTLSFLFLAICLIHGQNLNDNSLNADVDTIKNFYPLEDGDFWEYVGEDSRFASIYENPSIIKEILGDTLMPNGIAYKIIMWSRAAQDANYPPLFEYQRKDTSGNVYLYYNDKDNLLYDFTKNVGDTILSYISGERWTIKSIQSSTFFGISRSTIEIDHMDVFRENSFFAEELGLVNYGPKIWGGIIGGKKYGRLLAKGEEIDWNAFYPLHLGDYWVYKMNSCAQGHGCKEWREIIRITKDTVMPDGNKYYVRTSTGTNVGGGIERVDSLGNVWTWANGEAKIKYKFSASCSGFLNTDSVIRKYASSTGYLIGIGGNTIGQYQKVFKEGLGYTSTNWGNYSESLIGACINGVVWGDVSAIGVEDEPENIVADYKLEQNYPNPFNPTTNISFDLPKESFVSLIIYNILGEKIETLVNEIRRAGSHTVTFDAHNLPSGVYIYKITAGNYQSSQKMLLMK